MLDEKFSLKDLQMLDDVSYDEIDRIIERYENIRMKLIRWVRARGSDTDPDVYKRIDNLLADISQSKDVKKHRAILQQMMLENCNYKKGE